MSKKPIIQLTLTPQDKYVVFLGWLLLLIFWIYIAVYFERLPETIPTHYNLQGEADAYGSKLTILTLPLIATLLYLVVSLLNKYPHYYNYPFEITEDNAAQVYRRWTRVFRFVNIMLVVIFGLIAIQTVGDAQGSRSMPTQWIIPAVVLLMIALIVFTSAKSGA